MSGVKDKVFSLFKINTSKDYSKPKRVKYLHGGRKKSMKPEIQTQSEDSIIKNIRNPFKLKNENEAFKGRIMRDTKTHFQEEEDYYKPARVGDFLGTIILNMKVMVIKIKPYQSKNTLIKLNHT